VHPEPKVINLTNVENVSALPSSSTEVQDNTLVKTVTITVEPELE
jgi:ribosomal protein S8E